MFSKWLPFQPIFMISAYSGRTVAILMALPRFLGSRNPFGIIIYIKCNGARVAAIFSKLLPFQPIFTISQPIVDIQL